MAKKDLWKVAGNLEKEGRGAVEAKYTASKLPYTLKEEFRKAEDPELNKAIRKAESETYGGAIKGLDKYQNITNPFARRALAEQFQGQVEQGWKNLTDERTRRQGTFASYIDKWTGLYGAEAAKKQGLFQNKLQSFDRMRGLSQDDESKRRWEVGRADKWKQFNISRSDKLAASKAKQSSEKETGRFWEYAQSKLGESAGEDEKYDPKAYSSIRDEAAKYGISKKEFDDQMFSGVGEHEWRGLGIKTGLERDEEPVNYEDIGTNPMTPFGSKEESSKGDYYLKDGVVYKNDKFRDTKVGSYEDIKRKYSNY